MSRGSLARVGLALVLLFFGYSLWTAQVSFTAAWAMDTSVGYQGKVLAHSAAGIARHHLREASIQALRREAIDLGAWSLFALWAGAGLYIWGAIEWRLVRWLIWAGILGSYAGPLSLLINFPSLLDFVMTRRFAWLYGEEVAEEVFRGAAMTSVLLGGLVLWSARVPAVPPGRPSSPAS